MGCAGSLPRLRLRVSSCKSPTQWYQPAGPRPHKENSGGPNQTTNETKRKKECLSITTTSISMAALRGKRESNIAFACAYVFPTSLFFFFSLSLAFGCERGKHCIPLPSPFLLCISVYKCSPIPLAEQTTPAFPPAAAACCNAWTSACAEPAGCVWPRATMRPCCTITQPTRGFGVVIKSPLRASSSAARMPARSSSICTGVGQVESRGWNARPRADR